MEMAYIQAENLKHKRTFTKTLIVLAPFVTALMNFFVPLWFQLNSYNWWYILLYPGFLTLTCALIEQRDNGKLKYRAVASLPVSQNKVWKAKIGVAGIYSCVGNFIFLALNLLGGFAILVINEIPLTIVKKRIEGGANEKAVLRLFINCPFVCINFDFFWLNKARQLYMDF